MTIKVNAMGDACPIPVVKTQKAMQELGGAGTVETLVDNETAVQNLGKLAASKGCTSKTEKLGENEYRVTITVGENAKVEEQSGECYTCGKPKTVVVLSSDKMGSGNDELGGALMKALEDKARELKTRKVQQLGELVIATGADGLTPDELAGALVALAETKDPAKREAWAKRGAAFFQGKSRRSAPTPDRDAGGAATQSGGAQPASGGAGAT